MLYIYSNPMQNFRTVTRWERLVCTFFLVTGGLSGAEQEIREWTDVKGRKIEAKLLEIGDDKIKVSQKGKSVDIPLNLLSAADREYLDELKKSGFTKDTGGGDGTQVAPASGLTFAGKELIAGGTVNTYDFEYGEEFLAKLVKLHNADDTGYKIGVAVPANFDPSKPQKVFVVMSPGNNDAQKTAGNLRMLGLFAERCTAEGWLCVSYDSNLGLATKHYNAYLQAIGKLKEVWPEFKNWTIATGGISGGAMGSQTNTILLTESGIEVKGLFLQGCGGNANLALARDTYKVGTSKLRDIRCFISTGKTDSLVNAARVEELKAGIEREGIKKIKVEWYDGGHDLNFDQFAMALAWIAE